MHKPIQYEIKIDATRFAFARDHCVNGKIVFPAAGLFEMVLANTPGLSEDRQIIFTDVTLIHPLILEEEQVSVSILSFERQKENSYLFTIKNRSDDHSSSNRLHCEGKITLLNSQSSLPRAETDTIKKQTTTSIDRAGFYQLYQQAGGVTYGPYFKSVTNLMISSPGDQAKPAYALATIDLPEQAARDESRFLLHPARLDGLFQLAGIFSLYQQSDRLALPFYIARLIIRRLPQGNYSAVCTKNPSHHPGSGLQRFNMQLFNKEGEIEIELERFTIKEMTVSPQYQVSREQKHAKIESGNSNAVAIIGMAGQFPKANDLQQYWQNLCSGRQAMTEIPSSRWDVEQFYSEDPEHPGKSHCRYGSFLEDIAGFDPMFFGISANKAALIDPQQRLMLQTAWHVLEDAGYANGQLEQSKTGVFIGVSSNDYIHRKKEHPQVYTAHVASGNTFSTIANRISYFLGLRGPSLALDTACSSAMVAISLALDAIRKGSCDYALAGGVNITLSPGVHIIFSKSGILAADGQCQPFDHQAHGYVRGEGTGLILLKKLSAALQDNDMIYAVIKGDAVNHSGKGNGFNTPNSIAQREVISQALQQAALSPETIAYVEAHATGTEMGDAIEFRGLSSAYRQFTERKGYCALATVKANIGHLESASGIAGLIKVALALHHKKIPPLVNFNEMSQKIAITQSAFYINDRLLEWERSTHPRRAAMTSIGFGGTNCHMILEESPERSIKRNQKHKKLLFTLSTKSKASLYGYCAQLYHYLKEQPPPSFAGLIASLQTGRSHFQNRIALTAENHTQLLAHLHDLLTDEQTFNQSPEVAFNKKRAPGCALFLDTGVSVKAFQNFYTREISFRTRADQLLQELLAPGRFQWQPCPHSHSILEKNAKKISQLKKSAPELFTIVYYLSLAKVINDYGFNLTALAASDRLAFLAALCLGQAFSGADLAAILENRSRSFKGITTTIPLLIREKEEIRLKRFQKSDISLDHNLPGINEISQWKAGQKFHSIALQEIKGLPDLAERVEKGYLAGCAIDWQAYQRGAVFIKQPLPGYPFKKNRYWID